MALPNLANEILLQICCELPYGDLLNLSCTSRHFHNLYLQHRDYVFEMTASASLKAVLQALNTPSEHRITHARYLDAIVDRCIEEYSQPQKEQSHGTQPLQAREFKNVRETFYRLRHYMLLDGFAQIGFGTDDAYEFVPSHDKKGNPIKWVHKSHDNGMSDESLDLTTQAQAAHVAAMAYQYAGKMKRLTGTTYQDLVAILNWAVMSFIHRLMVVRIFEYDLPVENYDPPYPAGLSPFLEGWESKLRLRWEREKALPQERNMQSD